MNKQLLTTSSILTEISLILLTAFSPGQTSAQQCSGNPGVCYDSSTCYGPVSACSSGWGFCEPGGTCCSLTSCTTHTGCGACYNASGFFLGCDGGNTGCAIWSPNDSACCGGGEPPPPPPPPPPTATPTPDYPDLVVSDLSARNSSGDIPSYFSGNQRIYVRASLSNIDDSGYAGQSRIAVYKNKSSSVSTDTSSDIPMYIDDYGLPAGGTHNFESWSGGNRRDQFEQNYSFSQNDAGLYFLRAFADYNNQVGEEFGGSQNQRTDTYEVRTNLYGYLCWSQNEDAQCDTGEPKISNIRVELWRDDNNNYGTYIGHDTTVQTSGDRSYAFDNRKADAYMIKWIDPDWLPISSNPRYATLGPDTRIRFALKPAYTIYGWVFDDLNRDGVKQGSEPGHAGVVITRAGTASGTETSDSNGFYQFSSSTRGSYTLTMTVPPGYKAYPGGDNTKSIIIPLNSTTPSWRADFGINRVYDITGRVFVDADKSGGYDATKDVSMANRLVTAAGQNTGTDTTDANGQYRIVGLEPGDYDISVDYPGSNYISLTTQPVARTIVAANTSANFRLFGRYDISGNVFVDSDDSLTKNGSEINYPADPNITVSNLPSSAPNPLITNNTDGSYLIEGLISGQYTVRYPNLPSGYVMNHPRNGPPPSFVVTVGSSCSGGIPSPGGNCNNRNVDDLNFAIKSGQPWFQALGLDVRVDSGLTNPVPPAPNPACGGAYAMLPSSSATPGVAFTGNTPANFWQGQAAAAPYNWLVGGGSYPEVFTPTNGPTLSTSYNYLQSVIGQSHITTTDLSSICTLSNCTLPTSLASGVYQAEGDVNLNAFTVAANRDIVILIHGTLTLQGSLHVPTSSTLFYSVSGDIIVIPVVGRTATCPAPATGNADIEGMFSTDRNFIVQKGANCSITPAISDKQLNIQGAIVANAAQKGGNFQNYRDLCTENINFPSLTIKERADFILNAPNFLRIPSYIWQEVAP